MRQTARQAARSMQRWQAAPHQCMGTCGGCQRASLAAASRTADWREPRSAQRCGRQRPWARCQPPPALPAHAVSACRPWRAPGQQQLGKGSPPASPRQPLPSFPAPPRQRLPSHLNTSPQLALHPTRCAPPPPLRNPLLQLRAAALRPQGRPDQLRRRLLHRPAAGAPRAAEAGPGQGI
jgi:hypothetical protein